MASAKDIWKKLPCISEKPRYMAESAMYLFCFRGVTAEFDLLKAEMPALRRLIGGFGELFSGVRADADDSV